MSFLRRLSQTLLLTLAACLMGGQPVVFGDEPVTADQRVFFEQEIRPLLAEHCYSCHSVRAGKREGGLLLDSRSGWSEGGGRGPSIIAGDIEASVLIQAVRYVDAELQMPPEQPLPAEAVRRLEAWVQMGAPDPREVATEPSVPGLANPADPVAGRSHWAYQPLAAVTPWRHDEDHWSATDIDTFVFRRLRESGLRPAPDAAPETLVRRIYYGLTGLPPSWSRSGNQLTDNVHGFCLSRERSPDGAEVWPVAGLVDALLSSYQYGEHWGRHWLDLARYADSNGLDENFLFREAWRYRNWVIRAVNDDVALDRFLALQIAGDLLPYASIEQRDQQRIASGFLVIGPKVLLGNDPRERVMDVADEQLDTIGRAVLGLTLGCARCHDHKFDPVPAADYYALAGIMTSTNVMEQRYMLGQQREMERLVGLGEDGDEADNAYETYWREQRSQIQEQLKLAEAAQQLIEAGNLPALREQAGRNPATVAAGVDDEMLPPDDRRERQQQLISELRSRIDHPPAIPPRAMAAEDRSSMRNEAIRLAGRFDRPGDMTDRGFLRLFEDGTHGIPAGESGRRQLAEWLTDVEHGAGALTARVLANRIWYHLMGRGLVRTVDDFGRTGEPPSHPELLDYLASELVASGWSTRDLVRKIVLSRTFAMSSQHAAAAAAIDPDNRLLWRAPRRRLSPEALRDSMLVAAGTLDLHPMDSTVDYLGDQATAVGGNENRRRTNFPCRSIYLPVIRNDLPELFDVFNFADPHAATGMRPSTLVATQALFLMNNSLVMDAADATARCIVDPEASPETVARRLHERVLHQPGSDDDVAAMLEFLSAAQRTLTAENATDADIKAWAAVCHALFASSRFQVLE